MNKLQLIGTVIIVFNFAIVNVTLAQPDLEVTGIFYEENGESYAIVNQQVIKVGDKIQEAEVVEISKDFVKFRYGNNFLTKRLKLKSGKNDLSPQVKIEIKEKDQKSKILKEIKKTSEGLIIKEISDIKYVKLYLHAGISSEDLQTGIVTIRGYVIFRDIFEENCAIDHGVAKLSCHPWFDKFPAIYAEDFKRIDEAGCQYGYPIYFKIFGLTGDEIAERSIFAEPSPEVKFRIGNLETTCKLAK